MRKNWNLLLAVLALVLLLSGCGRAPASSAEVLDAGDTRFMIVTLEGTDAGSARVEAIKAEENSSGVFDQTAAIPLQPGAGNVHCAALESGGTYFVRVTRTDGSTITHLAVLDDSQVCSLHICLDPKADQGYRTLWPETPHNSPDGQ